MAFTPSPEALALIVPGMSRAPASLIAVHQLFHEALTDEYGDEVDAYLGPYPSGDPDDAVFVGYDGNPEGDLEAVVHRQSWAGAVGQGRRDEQFDIRCCVLNLAGANSVDAIGQAIMRVYGIFGVLARALHTDPHLGLGVHPYRAEITGPSSYLPPGSQAGIEARVTFDVHVETRI